MSTQRVTLRGRGWKNILAVRRKGEREHTREGVWKEGSSICAWGYFDVRLVAVNAPARETYIQFLKKATKEGQWTSRGRSKKRIHIE